MPYRFNRNEIEARFVAAAGKAVDDTVRLLQNEMRRTLSKPGTGRLYRRSRGYGRRRNARERGYHRASAPGFPPAADTGTLRRSWQTGYPQNYLDRQHVRDKIRPRVRLGTRVLYARWLQYGTSRMAARPYVDVAARTLQNSGKIQRVVDAAFRYARSL